MSVNDIFQDFIQLGLGFIYDSGFVIRKTVIDDGKGGYTRGQDGTISCSIKIDSVSESMRLELGYTDKDVALYILQNEGFVLTSDDEVRDHTGQRYALGTLRTDPVNVAWLVRGTPISG